jgi:hypothetical protein
MVGVESRNSLSTWVSGPHKLSNWVLVQNERFNHDGCCANSSYRCRWLGQPALHLRKPCRCFSELVLLADGALEQAWNVSVEGSVGLHKQEFIFCLVEARIS